ncbi:MAG: signal recognition particle protein Srp19 [Theionarchaea archaeon]|nr:signal recognition particle protein Srp19 [Theionarchaea archaeon]MBU7019427.1 signal recognition particle protein Srp19 [Theionarchaea archaeon]MBU7040401.1 signal recognition particle protein Srp19 [Theionarchaea archaeon]
MRKLVVWLANIDSSRTRSEGRKISTGLAVRDPTLPEVQKAAEHLSLGPESEDVQYPKDQGHETRTPGRVLLEKQHTKHKTLKLLCDEIRRIRQAKE